MSIVRQMRERQAMTAAPERSGLGATLLIGCAVTLGEAEHAPLLKTCIKGDDFEGLGSPSNPQAVYHVLKTVGTASRLMSMMGGETGGSAQLADYWRVLADCVYRQNSWNLCDPDNRVLAIESGGAFIRYAAAVAANPPQGRAGPMVLRNNAQSREQVLDALRARVRNGYLIADDFGPVQPPEIKKIMAETRTIANGCAKP